ncbi:hypothetical protein V6N12_057316 [Hibiscus sabdariffa]|uniref:Uncharacterized protein n=1 Tax=Hibiscus sabdariffa TaxID=183260 RepID=A0ABR2DBH4_9ROSI
MAKWISQLSLVHVFKHGLRTQHRDDKAHENNNGRQGRREGVWYDMDSPTKAYENISTAYQCQGTEEDDGGSGDVRTSEQSNIVSRKIDDEKGKWMVGVGS